MSKSRPGWIIATASAITMMGCSSNATEPKVVAATTQSVQTPQAKPATFEAWKQQFRAKALASGISASVFDNAFQGVSLNGKILELDTKLKESHTEIDKILETR